MAEIEWKSQQEIDEEENAPKPPTPQEQIEQLRLEQAQANAEIIELMLLLTGGV